MSSTTASWSNGSVLDYQLLGSGFHLAAGWYTLDLMLSRCFEHHLPQAHISSFTVLVPMCDRHWFVKVMFYSLIHPVFYAGDVGPAPLSLIEVTLVALNTLLKKFKGANMLEK